MPRAPPWAVLALAALLAGCALPAPGASEGEAPEWSFTDVDGRAHSRDEPPGNATVLFFMATWCSSCRATAPMLTEGFEQHADRGVRFYSIGFDPEEPPEALRRWQDEFEHPWPHGFDASLTLQRTFGITSQSSVVVLDAEGRVVDSWGYGRVTEAALGDALDRALDAA